MSTVGDIFGAGGVAGFLQDLADKIYPDPVKAAQAKAAITEAEQAGRLAASAQQVALALEQIRVNAVEAASGRLFVAGWRPAVGWVGAITLALMYWPKAVVLCVVWVTQAVVLLRAWAPPAEFKIPPYPDLGANDVLGLLGSILGVGTIAAMRTVEKVKGVAGSGH